MKRQWEIYAIDATRDIAFLVISSDAINALFPYVTVLPVLSRVEGREVYPFEAALGVSDRSDESSVALIHQIRTLKAEHLTDRRGMVQDEDDRTAVKEAMAAHFGF